MPEIQPIVKTTHISVAVTICGIRHTNETGSNSIFNNYIFMFNKRTCYVYSIQFVQNKHLYTKSVKIELHIMLK